MSGNIKINRVKSNKDSDKGNISNVNSAFENISLEPVNTFIEDTDDETNSDVEYLDILKGINTTNAINVNDISSQQNDIIIKEKKHINFKSIFSIFSFIIVGIISCILIYFSINFTVIDRPIYGSSFCIQSYCAVNNSYTVENNKVSNGNVVVYNLKNFGPIVYKYSTGKVIDTNDQIVKVQTDPHDKNSISEIYRSEIKYVAR